MIKLFAADLDGTLLNEQHQSDSVILNTMKTVVKAERRFVIATGRSLYENQQKSLQFEKLSIYFICMNGALIKDSENRILYQKEIKKTFITELLKKFPDIMFEFYGLDKTYLKESKEIFIRNFREKSIWNKTLEDNFLSSYLEDCVFEQNISEIINMPIYKINCRIEDKQMKKRFDQFVSENSNVIVNAPFISGAYELTDIQVNKGEAVRVLASRFGINNNEVAVYGDGGNDLTMLAYFENSYAPSNASKEAKETAKCVIGSNKDHAVPLHMLELLKKE